MPRTVRWSTMSATRTNSSAVRWSITGSERSTRRGLVPLSLHGAASALGQPTRMTRVLRYVWSAAALATLPVVMTSPLARPGAARTPAQDVTAAMRGELGEQVLDGCNVELARFGAEITPDEGRLLACLYGYGD